MAVSSKEDMLGGSALATEEVELPSGLRIEVRAINLEELRQVWDNDGLPAAAWITAGLVAPELTAEEVAAWVAAAPAGDPMAAFNKIQELSGLAEGAAKSAYKSVRRRSQS